MANVIPKYIDYDFDAILVKVDELLAAKKNWSGKLPSNTDRTLQEMMAHYVELLVYLMNRRSEENYIDTARLRTSLLALVGLVGYRERTKIAATTLLRITLAEAQTAPTVLASYPQIATKSGLVFTRKDAIVWAPGITVQEQELKQGTYKFVEHISDGTPLQEIEINSAKLDYYDLEIRDQANNVWTVLNEEEVVVGTQNVIVLSLYNKRGIRIVFGDNVFGEVPPVGTIFTIRYLETEGKSGNIYETNRITEHLSAKPTNTISMAEVDVTITNIEPATGGYDEETLDSIRVGAVSKSITRGRAITRADWETIVDQYPGVVFSSLWSEKDIAYPTFDDMNKVYVSLIPERYPDPLTSNEKNVLTPAEKIAFSNYLSAKNMFLDKFELVDPKYINFDVITTVTIDATAALSATLQAIRTALNTRYDRSRLRANKNRVRYSDIVQSIENVDGVIFSDTELHIHEIIHVGLLIDSQVNFTGQLPLPTLPGRFKLYKDQTLLAHDDGTGILVADNSSGVTGTVKYGASDEVQLLEFDLVPDGGNFQVSIDGKNSLMIPWNITATDLKNYLQLIEGVRQVTVTGNFSAGFTITFTGASGSQDIEPIVIVTNTLESSTSPVVITPSVVTEGGVAGMYNITLPTALAQGEELFARFQTSNNFNIDGVREKVVQLYKNGITITPVIE